ncbi:MAG TPA: hypothetical protein VGI75_11010, partial [Pirellulales bacterium]
LDITTGDNRDVVTVANANIEGDLDVTTGDATDAVSLSNVSAAGDFDVRLGDGNYDTLAVVNCSSPDASFDGGDNVGDTLVRVHNHFTNETDSGFQFVT